MDENRKQGWSGPTWLVLAAVALVPAAFATAFSSYEVVKSATLMGLMGVALILFGIDVFRGKAFAAVGAKIALVAYSLAAFAMLAATWSLVPMLGLVDGFIWVACAALFLFVVAPVGRAMRFADFAMAAAFGAILVGLATILDAAGLTLFTPVWNPDGATGVFDSKDFLTPYAVILMPVLSAALIRLNGIRKIVSGVGLGFISIALGLSTSAFFVLVAASAIVVSTLVILALQGFGRISLLLPALGVLIVASSLSGVGHFLKPDTFSSDANRLPILVLEPKDSMDQIVDTTIRMPLFQIGRVEEINNSQAYPYLFALGLDMFREKPIIGQGAGGWWQVQTKYSRPDDVLVKRMFDQYPAFQRAHNSYIEKLSEYGIIGFLLLLLWLLSVMIVTVTAAAKKEEREQWLLEHWGLIAGTSAGAAMAAFTPVFDFAGSAVVFFPALGLLLRESSMLNGFRGLSEPWRFGSESGWTPKFFFGLVPIAVGLGMLALMVPNLRGEYYRGLADHLMLRTHFTRAAEMYAKAHEVFPYRGEVLFNQGLALRRVGDLETAMGFIEKSVELRPFDSRAHVHLAQYYAQRNRPTETLTHARRSVELFTNNLEGRKAIAMAFDLEGRVEEAAIEIQKALALEPPTRQRAVLHHELGRYYEKDLGKPKLAIEHYTAAAKLTRDRIDREFLEFTVGEIEKQIQRDRLQREGKPIPRELMPTQPPKHDHGHGSGPHDSHGHGPDGHNHRLPVPKRPIGLPELPSDGAEEHDHEDHEGHDH